jgi:hypothetical protein
MNHILLYYEFENLIINRVIKHLTNLELKHRITKKGLYFNPNRLLDIKEKY